MHIVIFFALIFNAAIAVGAKTIKFLCVFFFIWLIKDDLPVPALPVINIFLFEFSKSVIISLKSSFKVKLFFILMKQ